MTFGRVPRRSLGATVLVVAMLGACTPTATPVVTPASHGAVASSSALPPQPRDPEPSTVPPSVESAAPAIEVESAAPWSRAIDAVTRSHDVSVAVGAGDRIVYSRAGRMPRIPASVQKLLTSMVALATFGPRHTFPTSVASTTRPRGGVVRDDLWLVGGGDPELGAAGIEHLAARIASAGVREIRGSVIGDTTAFSRRWWAPGWVEGLSRGYVARPTALTYEGNRGTVPPERAAASALTTALEGAGVRVTGRPSTGGAPSGLRTVAAVDSAPLRELLARQNHGSLNLHAEVVLRAIGAVGGAGTTAEGAGAVETWASSHGTKVRVRDGSGLSHGDRVGAVELTWLLLRARKERWGAAFEASLPQGGSGTLERRLIGVPVRAKTGTLFSTPVSSLAGYATDVDGDPIAFTVLSHGSTKTAAAALEDSIVRILTTHDVGR